MLYNIANAGVSKAAVGINGLPDQEDILSLCDHSKNNILISETLSTRAIFHGHASKKINDRIKPLWVIPSGNNMTFPQMAERSW
ncbi:hypothetical protein FHS10_000311 [Mucilaginibacter dorajii]|nr:hypothetical protein [Mucilaginibacter dorajii]MCS3732389.1 hypothetical protein [Mucilaginibacter dorajii]